MIIRAVHESLELLSGAKFPKDDLEALKKVSPILSLVLVLSNLRSPCTVKHKSKGRIHLLNGGDPKETAWYQRPAMAARR